MMKLSIAGLIILAVGLECGYRIGTNAQYQMDKKSSIVMVDAMRVALR